MKLNKNIHNTRGLIEMGDLLKQYCRKCGGKLLLRESASPQSQYEFYCQECGLINYYHITKVGWFES